MSKPCNTNSELFYCQLQIVRQGTDYALDEESLRSTLYLGFLTFGAPDFSIGSGQDDYIHIKNLAPKHVCVKLEGDGLTLKARAPFCLQALQNQHEVNAGEIIKLPVKSIIAETTMTWQVIFPNQTTVIGKFERGECLPPEAQGYLQDKYGTIEEIQHGDCCLIYKTQDDKLLKILRPSYAKTRGQLKRFINSARKFQVLPGDHFLKLEEIVYHHEYALSYVVTEYFPGETLENYIARKGVVPLTQAKMVVQQITETLLQLQQHEVCCCNIAPCNILINNNGEIKITGFFALQTKQKPRIFQGMPMVIPRYSAPELTQTTPDIDILADVFSLGAIFYNMLVGVAPFQCNSLKDYFSFPQQNQPVTAHGICHMLPSISPHMCEIMASMLALSKNDRPQPEQLLQQLFPGVKVNKHNSKPVTVNPVFSLFENKSTEDITESLPGSRSSIYAFKVISGPGIAVSQEYTFTGDRKVIIGKKGDFKIANDPKVSRTHAKIEPAGDHFLLIDLQSSNGTYVDGKKIIRKKITPNTPFTIGKTVLCFTHTHIPIAQILEDPQCKLTEQDVATLRELTLTCTTRGEKPLPVDEQKIRTQVTVPLPQTNRVVHCEEQDIWLGKEFGKYKILELLGRGAWGTVYRAHHCLLDIIVAIKILSPALIHPGKNAPMRFMREARHLAKLRHPNIVALYDVDIDQASGCYYIVMEYIKGQTLTQIMEEKSLAKEHFSFNQVVDIGNKICSALALVHEQGIIHRDIKPQNIMLPDNGPIKLTDFGLAKSINAEIALTRSGEMLGTPAYSPPESFAGEPLDARSDLYSLGITLFYLLANEPPFVGENPVIIGFKHLHGAVPGLLEKRNDVPLEFEQVIHKLLAKEPAQRFQTAQQVAEALQSFCPGTDKYQQIDTHNGDSAQEIAAEFQQKIGRNIKVLIIDDNAFMTKAVCKTFKAVRIEVAATAADEQQALRVLAELVPDVVILDINMETTNSLALLKHIVDEYACRVIILSAFTYEGAMASFDGLSHGAIDFIWKSAISQQSKFCRELLDKVCRVAQMEFNYLPPLMATNTNGKEWTPNKEARQLTMMIAGHGGLHTYLKIIPQLPSNIPCALVIIQNMSNYLMPVFVEYLKKHSKIPIKNLTQDEVLKQGVCYVATSAVTFSISPPKPKIHLPANLQNTNSDAIVETLKSAAFIFGRKIIGVVLSGNFHNAVEGLWAIKDAEGTVVVQKPETCIDPSMAHIAIDEQIADRVASVMDIPSQLLQLVNHAIEE